MRFHRTSGWPRSIGEGREGGGGSSDPNNPPIEFGRHYLFRWVPHRSCNLDARAGTRKDDDRAEIRASPQCSILISAPVGGNKSRSPLRAVHVHAARLIRVHTREDKSTRRDVRALSVIPRITAKRAKWSNCSWRHAFRATIRKARPGSATYRSAKRVTAVLACYFDERAVSTF